MEIIAPLEDVVRLARQGLEEGVAIDALDGFPGQFLATSARTFADGVPLRYLVTVDGCACPAGTHGRLCKHYAMTLVMLLDWHQFGVMIRSIDDGLFVVKGAAHDPWTAGVVRAMQRVVMDAVRSLVKTGRRSQEQEGGSPS